MYCEADIGKRAEIVAMTILITIVVSDFTDKVP